MKKLIITVALVISALGYSQQRQAESVDLAPFIGIGIANYHSGDTNSNNKSITRATFGATVDFYFNDKWSLRSGLIYQIYGTEIKFGGNQAEDNLRYITLPLNANWHFGSNKNWNLNFGPSFSFLSTAESSVNGMSFDVKDEVNPAQFGLNIGIGYTIEISEKFGIGISYNETIGLTEISKSDEVSFKNAHGAFNFAAVFNLD
jgi:hypothetical protein